MNVVIKDKLLSKLNCWEYKNCERQLGGEKVSELCACPVSVFTSLPDAQYNNGERLGRRCWRLSGTLCDDAVQGPFKEKIEACRKCSFYQLVKKEEGDDFVE